MGKEQYTKASEISSDTELDAKTLLKVSKQVQNILEIRGDLSLKVATRVTFLTRFIMIFLGIIVVSMLFFVIVFSTYISDLTETVITMNKVFGKMTSDMVVMQKHVAIMENKVNSMKNMQKNLVFMDASMTEMNNGMKQMANNMHIISNDMNELDGSVNKIDILFNKTENSLSKMKTDVNRLSRPMRMFNPMHINITGK